jgi:hypothetical protein
MVRRLLRHTIESFERKLRSEVPPGAREGRFRVLYVSPTKP